RTGQGALPRDGRARVVIEHVSPCVDGGRFPAMRTVGETVRVWADVFTDGHDRVSAAVRHRLCESGEWQEVEIRPMVNDRWAGAFEVHAIGLHEFAVIAWVDHFATWRHDLHKRVAAGQDVAVDLLIGAEIVEDAARHAEGTSGRTLAAFAKL